MKVKSPLVLALTLIVATVAAAACVTVPGQSPPTSTAESSITPSEFETPTAGSTATATATSEATPTSTSAVALRIQVEGSITVGEDVTVIVTDDQGNAIDGADVSVNGSVVGQSDSDGKLTVTVPSGDQLVITASIDQAKAQVTEDVLPAATEEPSIGPGSVETPTPTAATEQLHIAVDADLTMGGTATLTVTDMDGNPVEGATLSLNGQVFGVTDGNGQMQFQIPSDIRLHFEADANGASGSLDLNSGQQ